MKNNEMGAVSILSMAHITEILNNDKLLFRGTLKQVSLKNWKGIDKKE